MKKEKKREELDDIKRRLSDVVATVLDLTKNDRNLNGMWRFLMGSQEALLSIRTF